MALGCHHHADGGHCVLSNSPSAPIVSRPVAVSPRAASNERAHVATDNASKTFHAFAPGSYPKTMGASVAKTSVAETRTDGVHSALFDNASSATDRPRALTMSSAGDTERKLQKAGVFNTFDIGGSPRPRCDDDTSGAHAAVEVGLSDPGSEPPISVKIAGFNREKTGRPKYTVEVRFERQRWTIYKYYTDFWNLRNVLEGSQHHKMAQDLPKKHPIRLKLKMKLAITKRRAQRAEIPFVMHRMELLEAWLNRLLATVGPAGLDQARFLDDFFEAFPEDEPYNRSEPRNTNVNISTSMYHVLKAMGVPNAVYYKLWNHGHSVETIATLTQEQWMSFGASAVLSCELYLRLFKPQYVLRLPTSSNASRSSGLEQQISPSAPAMMVATRLEETSPPPYTPTTQVAVAVAVTKGKKIDSVASLARRPSRGPA